MSKAPPFWLPGVHAARRPFLLARGRIQAALRAWFAAHDFVEVETAALQVSPGNETHLHAFATELIGPGGEREPLYLRTSPEFAAKKLLAAGERRYRRFRPRVPQPRARRAASSRVHADRMVSRRGALRDADGRLRGADGGGRARGRRHRALTFRGKTHRSLRRAGAVTVAEAFARHAGIDLLATVRGGEGDRDRAGRGGGQAPGWRSRTDDTWGDIFSRILAEQVEPHLGHRPRHNII